MIKRISACVPGVTGDSAKVYFFKFNSTQSTVWIH